MSSSSADGDLTGMSLAEWRAQLASHVIRIKDWRNKLAIHQKAKPVGVAEARKAAVG